MKSIPFLIVAPRKSFLSYFIKTGGKILLVIICFGSFSNLLFAQSVGINTTTPNASSILDVKSSTKGMLLPRTSTTSRNAIVNPAKGLILYDTTTSAFWFHNGSAWAQLSSGSASNYWTANGADIYKNNAGNVGIGINDPLAPLHIKNDNEVLRISGTTPYISFYDNAGTNKGFIQQYNNNFYLGTPSSNPNGVMQFYLNNLPVMTLRPDGQLVIGSSLSSYSNTSLSLSYDGSTILGLTANLGRTELISTDNILLTPQGGFGNVGINTTSPANKLQIGSVGGTSFSTNDFAIGNGTNAMAIQQTNTRTLIGASTDIVLKPRNNNQGNVGINADVPTNKLQIGSVGATFFANNDLAIGNGTNAMAIYQTDAATLIGSSTDIILKPRNNGAGRVGINTNTPRAPLDVIDYVARPGSYYSYLNRDAWTLDVRDCQNCLPAISIFASNAIFAAEFDAFSDARIKDITGVSNSVNDLQKINALMVTNYTMKDKVKYGNRTFKKVIAQQVEKVYPQVVSKHKDFVPNVYQAASKIEKLKDGYLLSFSADHNISKDAKKLKILLSETEGMQAYDIVSIPSDKQVIVNSPDVKTNKAFVYGEEVDDFRTVDYEGLTTLNISATQELSKQVKSQQQQIKIQQQEIIQLINEIRKLKQPLNKLSNMQQVVEKRKSKKIKS